MRKISVEVSEEEYIALLQKKGDKTNREIMLEALGIEHGKRMLGRPTNASLDELKQSLNDQAFDRAEAEGKQRLHDELVKRQRRLGADAVKE